MAKSFNAHNPLICIIYGFITEQLHEIKYQQEMNSFEFIVGRGYDEAFPHPFAELITDERISMQTH